MDLSLSFFFFFFFNWVNIIIFLMYKKKNFYHVAATSTEMWLPRQHLTDQLMENLTDVLF